VKARRSVRIVTTATGSCRSARGMQWDIALADLSEGGCRVDDPRARLQVGEVVRLNIAGTGPHMAQVGWRQGSRVGLVFQRALTPQVVRRFAEADWDGARAAFDEDLSRAPVRRVL
jgi:PilZ domain